MKYFACSLITSECSQMLSLISSSPCSDVTGKWCIFRILLNGLLFEEHDADNLASKLAKILNILSIHAWVTNDILRNLRLLTFTSK